MKKNKVLKIVLIVLGALVALLAAAVLGVLFYLHSMAAGIPETLPDAPADSTQVTLTDDEIDKLLSGEITLEELADEAAASGSGEQEASASAPQQETGAVSSPAGSSASSGSAASRTESSSTASSSKQETAGTANSGTEKPASSSGKQEAGYEAEVKVLLKQLYSVKARAEAELNSCIAGAKAEFKSLPESQQTQARKISIVLARSGRLYAMQASYDREVGSIVSQMRAILTANGQSTHLGTQGVFDAVQFLFDLGLSLSLHTFSFDASLITGFVDDLSTAFLGLLNDFSCLCLSIAQLMARFLLGQLQVASCSVSSVQSSRNLLLTFLQCRDDRRPHELHAEQHKDEERNGLANQGCINVHANTSLVRCQSFSKARITGLLVPGTG